MKSFVAGILSLFTTTAVSRDAITIKFSGPVLVKWESYDGVEDREIGDPDIIKKFDGLVYKDYSTGKPKELSVYLQDGTDTKYLYDKGIRAGFLKYDYISSKKQLWISIEFTALEKLSEKELQDLYGFCEGQWYDGAGSNFSGEIADKNNGTAPLGHPIEVYVSQTP